MADVLTSTPDRANAILYVDVPAIRKLTPGTLLQADLSDSMGEIRIASDLNLKTFEPLWEIGYVRVANLPDAESLAKSMEGYVDSIAGSPVVWSPKEMYLVPSGNNALGLVRPADRRLVSRWLKKESSGGAASYLKHQVLQGTQYISLLLAIDLEDSFSPTAIRQRVETFESLKGKDLDSITATLSTVRGIRVIVGRKNLNECIISLDFGVSPSSLLPFASKFFVEVLDRNDSSIPEASSWSPKLEGNSISFRGTITAKTIDDLVGIFTLQRQTSNNPILNDSAVPITNSESAILNSSIAYFGKTTDIIKRVRDYSADSTGDRAQWNGKMARRLDELPTLNVDPELVDFTVKVSQGLRGNMVAIQQTNIAYGASATVNAGSYGYYNNGNEPYKYNAVARAKGNSAYRELIANIEQMEADMRRKMTDKFKVQF